jgi:hypothetical protein
MMGDRQVQQDALFYEFSLERHVPEAHLLRTTDRFVELRSATCAARLETILASLSSTVLASAPYPNRREDALIGPTEAPSSRTESSPLLLWRISARSRRICHGDGMFLFAFGGEMQIYGSRP